jgi:phosphotransferase system enzyme I (PtsP)
VPILRGGDVIGVLVVQNITERTFVDQEVEALQTVAMVLAEMLAASGETAPTARLTPMPRACLPVAA